MEIKEIQSKAGTARVEIRNPREHLQASWARGRFFEQELLEYIYWHYGGYGGTYIDVGAAIGNHTLFFAAFCNPSIVLSIEPVAASMAHNRHNIQLNNLQDKVKFYSCALGTEIGTGRMERNNLANLGDYQLYLDGDEVPITTLDNILEGNLQKRVVLVKIDVEKQELNVLKGAANLLETQSPALFLECRSRSQHQAIRKWLTQYHYNQVGVSFRGAAVNEFRRYWQ